MRAGLAILIVMAALAGLSAVGCRSEEPGAGGPAGAPTTREVGASSDSPEVPPGAPYDLDGRRWRKLPQADQFLAATAFVSDNPARCEGADVGSVSLYATKAYAGDSPLDVPAAEVLAEGCEAG